ncbi:creatininase family protein [Exiguobacterium sp. S22-S28]|uniref:creatininase family protein n=1 Tax=Exiguobacterium sp. S22-S28 TaxID=3342768 RepID=UPI00372D3AC8
MLSYKNSTQVIQDSQTNIAILSVGATEQFGPYLPMHLDTLIAERYATVFGERLNAYVLPTLPFNTSEEHANQAGTVTVSPTVLSAMLEEIIVNLFRQGFNQFVLCNGHGGAYWESAFVKQINFKYPELVDLKPMGGDVPLSHYPVADYVFWDQLTTDGCWGHFEPGVYSPDELARIGETFWTTFIDKRAEHLEDTLTTAVRLRNLPVRKEEPR